jgi:hypothetical protein
MFDLFDVLNFSDDPLSSPLGRSSVFAAWDTVRTTDQDPRPIPDGMDWGMADGRGDPAHILLDLDFAFDFGLPTPILTAASQTSQEPTARPTLVQPIIHRSPPRDPVILKPFVTLAAAEGCVSTLRQLVRERSIEQTSAPLTTLAVLPALESWT